MHVQVCKHEWLHVDLHTLYMCEELHMYMYVYMYTCIHITSYYIYVDINR